MKLCSKTLTRCGLIAKNVEGGGGGAGAAPPGYTVHPNKKETCFIFDIFIATQDLIKLYSSLSRAFSLLSFDTKHISMHE